MKAAPARPDIPSLIEEAFGAGTRYPTPERFTELDKLLKEEIERLKPIVQRIADSSAHRSRDWYAAVNAIDEADYALTLDVATTPIAGGMRVAELARLVRALRKVGGIQP
ncbi:DUF6415 family natural product biosynthesis protein [Streptomyces sp. NPDC050538]|uniref:DUF6415 family natural product biosynthesis protein n=1 Tax=Streptomyces sp. NPDC050538 TaxID=3365627 RepID=UPI00379EE686